MAIIQLTDGSIRICRDLAPNPRTEWRLEVTATGGPTVALGIDFPLRDFLRDWLLEEQCEEGPRLPGGYGDDYPATEFDDEDDLGDADHPDDCQCVDCEGG